MRNESPAIAYGTSKKRAEKRGAFHPDASRAADQATASAAYRVVSERFGEIAYTSDAVITFSEGPAGFEELHAFILIDVDGCEPFQWLISLDNPTIGFPVIQADVLDAAYADGVMQEAEMIYGVVSEQIAVYVIATLKADLEASTINLRAPVFIDAGHRRGRQIILISDIYSTEYLLFQAKNKRERGA